MSNSEDDVPGMMASKALAFSLGRTVVTPGVMRACSAEYMHLCLTRHAMGDWGLQHPADLGKNTKATYTGERVMSVYALDPDRPSKGHGENTLWIITEADRSVTTLLLPDEY